MSAGGRVPRVIAYDAGGTMTDSFIVDGAGEFVVGKAQTTPEDESRGLLESTGDALGQWGTTAEAALPTIRSGVFSGTAMLNRLLERKGMRVGCLVSAGLEDYLRLERGLQTWLGMTYSDRLHVTTHHHNEPLVPRDRMKGVRGRIDVQGREAIPLYEDDVRSAVRELAEARVEGIVICLLQSFVNPAHERRAAEVAGEVLNEAGVEIPLFISSDLYPLRGDFPRLNSTLIEAYAAEPSRHQFGRLRDSMSGAGAGFDLRIMAAHGGTIAIESRELARTLVSGPIGGIVGARYLADELGIDRVVCSDIGGTSFDLALINEGELAIRQTPDIGRYLLNLPMVEIESIGAGTGSSVRVDPGSNRPEIGPDSAGARIGTAWPEGEVETITITDLNLVLGRLNSEYFLGGQVTLDMERARDEVRRQLAEPLGLELEEAAGGVVDLFEEQLRYAALARVLGKGYTSHDHALFCYGGGGPLHVAGYTKGAGYADVMIPTWAAGFSAFGCACADFSYRFDQTTGIAITADNHEEVRQRLVDDWNRLAGQAFDAFARSGVPAESVTISPRLRMQYSGQLNDIEVTFEEEPGQVRVEEMVDRFEDLYGRIYAYGASSPELGYTVTSIAVVGSAPVEKPTLPDEPLTDFPPTPKTERQVWWTEESGFLPSPVFEQDEIRAGQEVVGPAIVESPSTTFAIPPGRSARLDRNRIFHLNDSATSGGAR
ncbi:MAG: hydantoinase/oxoprolinase family protein [Solirubrobacterales bacterium]|nr:hydantoinase/oxoprolinase family protein [Solirubrobacterales bacterium]OJU95353.1 MAG: acetone carboxylase subunit beta [Solirubrobacterales bacterium 67-14]